MAGKASSKIYGTKRWKVLRSMVMSREPLCRHCKANGVIRGAEEVDHIIPISDDIDKAYSFNNLQPLCRTCHFIKTNHENLCKRLTEAEYNEVLEWDKHFDDMYSDENTPTNKKPKKDLLT